MSKTEKICCAIAAGTIGYNDALDALQKENPALSGDAIIHLIATAPAVVKAILAE